MNNSPKVFFKTFGCRTNVFDTQVMIANLKDYQVTQDEENADIVVINSCTVTNGADSGVRGYINKLNREKPNIEIYFTGCGVTTQAQELQKKGVIKSAFTHSHKENINSLLKEKSSFFISGDQNHIDKTIVTEFVGKSRAFLKIQEGCDFDCSYCIIPSVRGSARSLEEKNILEQINVLIDDGFSEFILTGTNVGSYGQKNHTSLSKLLKKIIAFDRVKRVRIGSLEPIQIDDELIEILKDKKITKQLHIALQHTDDNVLKMMNRRNNYYDDKKLLDRLYKLGFALGTDFIVGFPGEKEKNWLNAKDRVKDLPLTHIHPFIYSKRDSTPASLLKDTVLGDVSKERLRELNSIIKDKNFEFRRDNINQTLDVLVEKSLNIDGIYESSGFDQFYNKINIISNDDLLAQWVCIKDYEVSFEGTLAKY